MTISLKPLIALCSVLLFTTVLAEPPNLALVTKEIITWHDTGAYEKEMASVLGKAREYMATQVNLNNQSDHKKNLAIVLDIDETSLANYQDIANYRFTPTHDELHAAILAAHAPAIQPTLTLYQEALRQGVSVFFVTGRDDTTLAATKTNLKNAGYTKWSGLFLRPVNYQKASIVPFKAGTRAAITQKGYTIIASIGDQFSDLQGGYTQKGFKLPNPFYFIP